MKIGVAQPVGGDAVQCWCWNYAGKCGWRGKADMSGAFHLTFSASEVFLGVAVSDWPLPYAVLTYRSPSFVIFVVQPVFQVITAELPSSFQVPVIPSPRVAFSAPPLDSVISNGCPAVSFTFHTPSNVLWATAPKLVTTKKQAAIAAFLIFVPPGNVHAHDANGALRCCFGCDVAFLLTSQSNSDYPNQNAQCSRRQRIEQCLSLLKIARVEAFGEPAIDRSEKVASFIPLALIAPEPRHAHRCAQFPGFR